MLSCLILIKNDQIKNIAFQDLTPSIFNNKETP